MTISPSFSWPSRGPYPFFFAMIGLSVVIGVLLPRGMALLPGLLGLVFYVFTNLHPATSAPHLKQKLWLFPSVILLLALASALWAISPDEALTRTGKLIPILVPGTLFALCCRNIGFEVLQKYAAPFIGGGLLLTLIFLNIEYLFDYPLYRLFRGLEFDEKVKINELNRSVVVITALLFPVTTLVSSTLKKTPGLIAGIYILAYAPLLFLTDSQSALLAFFAGLVFFLAFPYGRKWAWYALGTLIITAFIVMPFISIWLFKHYAAQIDEIYWLRRASAANRLEIWDYVSRYMLQKPFTGFGIEATRTIKDFDSGEIYQRGTSILHPHNAFIQIWLEFGLLGVTVMSALLVAMLRRLSQLTAAAQKACLPGIICLFSVSLTGYGLWQSWWIGLFMFVAGICALAVTASSAINTPDTKAPEGRKNEQE